MSSIFDWSLTAANNANADSSVNWQEGQLPSTVNDSARSMMMRVAQLLKDIGGTVTAGGTANAITVSSNSPIASYATGQIIGFKASATNTAATTLNVNGIGAKAIRKSVDVTDAALSGSEIVANGIYILVYDATLNASAGGWLLTNPSAAGAFATIASAATTDLSTVGSQNVTVTGTTTITAFGTAPAGTFRRLRFSGALTLTYNATSLILPGAVNITTAAGDVLELVSLGSGNWVATNFQPGTNSDKIFVGDFATTSGTSVDVNIPAGAKRIVCYIIGVSTNGTSIPVIQLGTSGSFETTNYFGSVGEGTSINFSNGFAVLRAMSAAAVMEGKITIDLAIASSNTWVVNGTVGRSDTPQPTQSPAGRKALSGTLTRIRLTTAGGTDTLDAGSMSVWAEV
jgi:hypothetical protein